MTPGRCAVGVDLGGTKIAVAVADSHGRILAEREVPTRAEAGPDAIVDAIGRQVEACVAECDPDLNLARTIGVGVPGQLDADRRRVLGSPNLPGWNGYPLAQSLTRRLGGRPVRLENDANLVAVAEHALGAGTGVDDLIVLTIGTGVGGGVISAGRLVTGAHGWAGELGHILLDPAGPVCGMGHRGCLESLSSGRAVERRARERLARGEDSLLDERVDDPDGVTGKAITDAAERGDPLCRDVLEEAGDWLGVGIASFQLALDPAVVVVGGGLGTAGDLLLEPARRTARAALFPDAAEALTILPAGLGPEAGVLGAALLALNGDP